MNESTYISSDIGSMGIFHHVDSQEDHNVCKHSKDNANHLEEYSKFQSTTNNLETKQQFIQRKKKLGL